MRDKTRIQHAHVDVYKKAGLALLVRGSYFPDDLESGDAKVCPVCWQPAYKQAGDSRCPRCYGTGIDGGYLPSAFTWGRVIFTDFVMSDKDDRATAGFFEVWTGTGSAGYLDGLPIINGGDIIYVATQFDASIPTVTQAHGIFEVVDAAGGTKYKTLHGDIMGAPDYVYNFRDELLYQSFGVALLPKSDPRYLMPFLLPNLEILSVTVGGVEIEDGDINVPLSLQIDIEYSETVTVEDDSKFRLVNSAGVEIAAQSAVANGAVVTVTLATPMDDETWYRMLADDTFVKGVMGGETQTPLNIEFTTEPVS